MLPNKVVSIGAYFHSKLELPPYAKLKEHVSIKLTCINYGSQTIIKSFKFISSSHFSFLTHDGIQMVSKKISYKLIYFIFGNYTFLFPPLLMLHIIFFEQHDDRSKSVEVKVEGNGGYSVVYLPITPNQVCKRRFL